MLPPAYRQLLLANNGGWFEHEEICPIQDAKRYRASSIGLDYMEGINTGEANSGLERAIETASDWRIPPTLLPIDWAAGSAPILLGLSGGYRDKVYFWDRDSGETAAECLFLITDSLPQFVGSIHEDPGAVREERMPIFRAVELGDVDRLKELLRATSTDVRNDNGDTLLMCAARHGRLTALEALLDCGADVNARDPDGETALYRAAISHSLDSVKLLLQHGADIDAQIGDGETALIGSIVRLGVRIPKFLIPRGANVNLRTTTGQTALSVCRHVELRKLLLDARAIE